MALLLQQLQHTLCNNCNMSDATSATLEMLQTLHRTGQKMEKRRWGNGGDEHTLRRVKRQRDTGLKVSRKGEYIFFILECRFFCNLFVSLKEKLLLCTQDDTEQQNILALA